MKNIDHRPHPSRRGKLYIIGIGPGNTDQITIRAQEVLAKCDVIMGFRTYLKHISMLTVGKEIIVSEMRQEMARAKEAVQLARAGRVVALVSGGDPNIYGMSAAVYELLSNNGTDNLEVEVVPGVTAVCAAAAQLGSPLGSDFACVSLSDLLVPWEVIATRLRAAAAADFVIAIYNPRSRGRPEHLARACDIILEYRSPDTAVGLVRNAYREGEEVLTCDLVRVKDYNADMFTLIIVGNTTTRIFAHGMLTPRGYDESYGG